jgi:hypothetical protein
VDSKLIEAVQPGTITAKMNDGVDFGDQKIFKHLQNQQVRFNTNNEFVF